MKENLANPWELMATSFCTRIMKLMELMKVPGQSLRAYGYILLHYNYEADGTHECTWPILESLWLHPPALELWNWWNGRDPAHAKSTTAQQAPEEQNILCMD